MRWLVVLGVLLLGACGYHVAGTSGSLPDGVTRIQVVLFENTTSEPFLEQRLTDAVIDQLRRHADLQVVAGEDRAEAVLSGTILSFNSHSSSFSGDDRIGSYRAHLGVEVMLRRSGSDELLWSGRSQWSTDFDASAEVAQQADFKELGLDELSRRLAEEIVYQLLDDF